MAKTTPLKCPVLAADTLSLLLDAVNHNYKDCGWLTCGTPVIPDDNDDEVGEDDRDISQEYREIVAGIGFIWIGRVRCCTEKWGGLPRKWSKFARLLWRC